MKKKIFLLESIVVLSAIFTACCSSGSRLLEKEEIPTYRDFSGLKSLELTLSLFIHLQMDIVTS